MYIHIKTQISYVNINKLNSIHNTKYLHMKIGFKEIRNKMSRIWRLELILEWNLKLAGNK